MSSWSNRDGSRRVQRQPVWACCCLSRTRLRAAEDLAGIRSARTAWKEARGSGRELARRFSRLSPQVRRDARRRCSSTRRRRSRPRPSAASSLPAARQDWTRPGSPDGRRRPRSARSRPGRCELADASLLNPVRGTLALAADAARRGARLFERSPVVRTKFTRKDALVVLEHGTIRARGVVVATGEPGRLFGQLRRHVREQQGFVVVTEPLSPVMRRETGKRDAVLAEIGEAPHLLRWLPESSGPVCRRPWRPRSQPPARPGAGPADGSVDVRNFRCGIRRFQGSRRAGAGRRPLSRRRMGCRGSARIGTTRFTFLRWRSAGMATPWRGGRRGPLYGSSRVRPGAKTSFWDSFATCNLSGDRRL